MDLIGGMEHLRRALRSISSSNPFLMFKEFR